MKNFMWFGGDGGEKDRKCIYFCLMINCIFGVFFKIKFLLFNVIRLIILGRLFFFER